MFTDLQSIPLLGPKTILKLNRLNIFTPNDLLYHFPHRYLDFTNFSPIKSLLPNQPSTIRGQIISIQNIYTKSRKNILKITLRDASASIDLIWFNQPYLAKNFHTGKIVSFAGVPTIYQSKITLISPFYSSLTTGKIIPIYPQTSGLSSKWFQKIFSLYLPQLIDQVKETLPTKIIHQHQLLPLSQALQQIHQPQNQSILQQAIHRLSLEEILGFQTKSYLAKKQWLSITPPNILKTTPAIEKKLKLFTSRLPFKLTSSQKQVWREIKTDLLSEKKVQNRLLQGDVGSGKTIIAILGSYLTHLNHQTSLILAPTEILASQHLATFKKLLPKSVPIHLLTASTKPEFAKLTSNSIIIATHAAIFQKHSLPHPVSFLTIDEQHKFGVKQRNFLSQYHPHTLTMTATPIPRTIYQTFLGNLDLSFLKNPPKNRLPIKTFVVPLPKQTDCYRWVEQQIATHRSQAFIVCPLIDQSDTLTSVNSAKEEFTKLTQIFSRQKLALIHGKIPISTRTKTVSQFASQKIDILVTTPIIEVGIDIPSANIIIILSADRFGLAQLHQLRGRVGRNGQQAFCYLFSQSTDIKAQQRLLYLQSHHSGQKIAEYDLKNRGPGEIFSTLQHGFPSLKLANLSDTQLINLSQDILKQLIKQFPGHLKILTQNHSLSLTTHRS